MVAVSRWYPCMVTQAFLAFPGSVGIAVYRDTRALQGLVGYQDILASQVSQAIAASRVFLAIVAQLVNQEHLATAVLVVLLVFLVTTIPMRLKPLQLVAIRVLTFCYGTTRPKLAQHN